jgi:hypothetical protein
MCDAHLLEGKHASFGILPQTHVRLSLLFSFSSFVAFGLKENFRFPLEFKKKKKVRGGRKRPEHLPKGSLQALSDNEQENRVQTATVRANWCPSPPSASFLFSRLSFLSGLVFVSVKKKTKTAFQEARNSRTFSDFLRRFFSCFGFSAFLLLSRTRVPPSIFETFLLCSRRFFFFFFFFFLFF